MVSVNLEHRRDYSISALKLYIYSTGFEPALFMLTSGTALAHQVRHNAQYVYIYWLVSREHMTKLIGFLGCLCLRSGQAWNLEFTQL